MARLPAACSRAALVLAALGCFAGMATSRSATGGLPQWRHLSSQTGDLPVPNGGTEQTAALVLDVDKDGRNDFVIAERTKAPSLVWFRRGATGWTKYVMDDTPLHIEAGGAALDVDRDGDLDVVMGGDSSSSEVWWWENPYPHFDPRVPWRRHVIKSGGATQHHDQIVGDFDGNGEQELAFWNQGAAKLLIAHVPARPADGPWPLIQVYSGSGEGLAKGDVDGDGRDDLIGGGRWFRYVPGRGYQATVIDAAQSSSRVAVGDVNGDGRLDVVMAPGDLDGRLKWYENTGNPSNPASWVPHDLLGETVRHGHSLAVADVNGDGKPDIFCAEMRKWTSADDNPGARMWLFLGDGRGGFTKYLLATGVDNHESKLADLNSDGRMDILVKPYNWQTPRIEVWLAASRPVGRQVRGRR